MLRVARVGVRKSAAFWWLFLAAVVGLLFIARAAGAAPRRSPQPAGAVGKPAERAKNSPAANQRAKKTEQSAAGEDDDDDEETRVHKTDAEWKKLLTRKQYRVARRGETETPFTGKYWKTKQHGTYHCVCCDAPLFSSDAKFESGTGWPSFWAPVKEKRLSGRPDYGEGSMRVEVLCTRCDAHLGHVFADGPPPTGLRYCINSASLELKEEDRASDAKPPAAGD